MFAKDITLDEALESIKGAPEFKVVQSRGYTFIKYNNALSRTFPNPDTDARNEKQKRLFQIRRECRGIGFDTITRKVVTRKFHKFFNLNERPESNIEKINWNRPFIVLEKLDGSLIGPVQISKNKIAYSTMSGFTDISQKVEGWTKYTKEHFQYDQLCKDLIQQGKTPLFEWCSKDEPIVIKHKENSLTLLAVRDISTGEYMKYSDVKKIAAKYNVPCVLAWEDAPRDGKKLIEAIREKKDIEGFIVFFEDGDMYKCKTLFYSCANCMSPNFINQRVVMKAICGNVIDDLVAFVDYEGKKREALQQFIANFEKSISKKAKLLTEIVNGTRSDEKLHLFEWEILQQLKENKELNALDGVREYIGKKVYTGTAFNNVKSQLYEWLELKEIPEEFQIKQKKYSQTEKKDSKELYKAQRERKKKEKEAKQKKKEEKKRKKEQKKKK